MATRKLKEILLVLLLLCAGLAAYWLSAPGNQQNSGNLKIMLIGIDAGSWDILRELMADGKLPNFKKLVLEGSAGYLDSISWKELTRGDTGYISPIVWASISTGKMPTKHGIEDFTLAVPSDVIASILAQGATGYSVLRLPDVAPANMQLWFRARASAPASQRRIGVYLNQTLLKEISVGQSWKIYDMRIPPDAWKLENSLNFFYEVPESEKNKPIVDFNFIRLFDQYDEEVHDFQFLREQDRFVSGWQILKPEKTTLASANHLRARPLWDILSEHHKRVGIVGWWETWPAPKVNGYLVSGHTGLHGERIKAYAGQKWLEKIQRLTYPPDYLNRVQELAFVPQSMDPEIRKRFYDIGKCSCVGTTQDKIFRNFYWQDRFFELLSLDLLKNKGPFDFFAVYLAGVDAAGHQFLRFKERPELLKDCTGCDASRLPSIVENYYRYTDEIIGKFISFADKNTVTMLVTDHGQFLGPGVAGLHKNNGFVILHGFPIRTHLMTRAKVLDVAPTVLYLMGLPVPQDMDGSVMTEAFRPEYLEKHPIQFRRTYETITAQTKEKPEIRDEEAEKEGLEKLKALGYVQ